MTGNPFSRLNSWGSTVDEVAAPLAGDDLFVGGQAGTRCVDIAADRSVVFDFLSQMGFGRAGWYSYDWLDNLGRRSADDLRNEWMVTDNGDAVPGGPINFVAHVVQRPETLVLNLSRRRMIGHDVQFSLTYCLRQSSLAGADVPVTRLVTRARVLVTGPLGPIATRLLLIGDAVMVRRQLLGLKQRAESYAV